MSLKYQNLASFLLRIGLATVFLYAAIASFLDPLAWIGFFPSFLRDMFDANKLLMFFSVFEIALALWLLSGVRAFLAGLAAAATLAGIILGNLGILDIVFRDVAILFAALALVVLHKKD